MFRAQTPTRIFVWIGAACPPAFAAAARYHAELLRKYEHAHPQHRPSIVDVRQSAEPPELLALLDPPLLDPEAAKLHARRASLADELATGSTPCFPAQDEVSAHARVGIHLNDNDKRVSCQFQQPGLKPSNQAWSQVALREAYLQGPRLLLDSS